jgi:RimJ/RimL family protein N-acetyltransferase
MKAKNLQVPVSCVAHEAFLRVRTGLECLGIRTSRLRRRLEDRDLAIRLYRFRDVTALHSLCRPEVLSAASGARFKAFSCFLSFWRWMHTTFQAAYVIEVEESGRACRMIGLVGVYRTKLGKSLWLSLVIFDAKDRRRGYGQRTLQLLLSCLEGDRIVKWVWGEVLAGNAASLRLLEKLGFDVFAWEHGRLLLGKQLGSDLGTARSQVQAVGLALDIVEFRQAGG